MSNPADTRTTSQQIELVAESGQDRAELPPERAVNPCGRIVPRLGARSCLVLPLYAELARSGWRKLPDLLGFDGAAGQD
jgi:hypothetical protein